MSFSWRPTFCLLIESQTLRIWPWNDLDLEMSCNQISTLTQWAWYWNVTQIWPRCTSCTKMKFLRQLLQMLSPKQTDRPRYTQRRYENITYSYAGGKTTSLFLRFIWAEIRGTSSLWGGGWTQGASMYEIEIFWAMYQKQTDPCFKSMQQERQSLDM